MLRSSRSPYSVASRPHVHALQLWIAVVFSIAPDQYPHVQFLQSVLRRAAAYTQAAACEKGARPGHQHSYPRALTQSVRHHSLSGLMVHGEYDFQFVSCVRV
jgi:hypothetical protein